MHATAAGRAENEPMVHGSAADMPVVLAKKPGGANAHADRPGVLEKVPLLQNVEKDCPVALTMEPAGAAVHCVAPRLAL